MASSFQLKKISDKAFAETFKSIQLLGFTVLYYDFNYDTEKLTEFNRKMHEINKVYLDDEVMFDAEYKRISNILGVGLDHLVKEFPYRARVQMMGGLPKGRMDAFNMANLSSINAIDSYMILACHILLEGKRAGKTTLMKFWSTLKEYSVNYSNGMEDEFIVQYFKDQINLELCEGD